MPGVRMELVPFVLAACEMNLDIVVTNVCHGNALRFALLTLLVIAHSW